MTQTETAIGSAGGYVTTFDSMREALSDLLRSVKEGKTQLPDFQRDWVWDDARIRSLLASVSLCYPVGAVMLLQTGNPKVRFKPRPVEGVQLTGEVQPERLILDGQQRLTSLFQVLLSGKPVATRDHRRQPLERLYYVHIGTALDPTADREDAIRSLPADRKLRNFRGEVIADYSTTELECAGEMLPLSLMFDVAGLTAWQMKYLSADPARIAERLTRWNALVPAVIQPFQQYQVPVILLRKETAREAVCQVFEKVNTGGVQLDVFELLTATYAADEFDLRKDWEQRRTKMSTFRLLAGLESTDFLQTVALLATHARRKAGLAAGQSEDNAPGVSCKRREILGLSLEEYVAWADAATQGFTRAAKLLHMQNFFDSYFLPYQTQLTPLAAILALLGERGETDGVRGRLVRWFWCGVFGELYGGSTETRFARDLVDVLAWLEDGPEPQTILDSNFAATRLLTLKTRNSAAYKGLSALLLRDGGRDFMTGSPIDAQLYFDESIDIHHIFPKDWCEKNGIDADRKDCIVNKTPLSATTNRKIGGNAPSVYLPRVQRSAQIDEERLDEILRSHVIEPVHLRGDDFEEFFLARANALLDRIERATGKPIGRDALAERLSPTSQDTGTGEAA